MEGFWSHGVTDFDLIGLSYYWAWHKPTSITDAGNVVSQLRQLYPGKEVMIFETGYPWTLQWKDNASNLITELNPAYAPASPDNQRKWLVDLTQEMINKGAKGVLYWEPAWQSSSCWTQWGQGSHQEHATFFDFQNNLLAGGGMDFMTHVYDNLVGANEPDSRIQMKVWPDSGQRNLRIQLEGFADNKTLQINLLNSQGGMVASQEFVWLPGTELELPIPVLPAGLYYCTINEGTAIKLVRSVVLGK